MSRRKVALIKKVILLAANQQSMLDSLMDTDGFISESEVIRNALTFFYKKRQPEYLKPSVTEKAKLGKIDEEKRINEMSNEDFVAEFLKGVVMVNKKGEKFAVFLAVSNSIYVKELSTIKELVKGDAWFVNTVIEQMSKGRNLLEELPNFTSELRSEDIWPEDNPQFFWEENA